MKNVKTFEQFVNESVNEARGPKNWDSQFTMKAIEAYKNGEFDLEDDKSIADWDKEYNGGRAPKPAFNTKELVSYAIKTGKKPDGSKLDESVNEGEGQLKNVEVIEKTHVIEYYVDSRLLRDHGMGDQEWAETVADDVSLQDGNLHFENGSFEISGNTKAGNSLLVMQDGEYNMYGGPYEPKMQKPTMTLNGKSIIPQVMKAFKSYGWDSKMIDISRTDIWGNIVK